MTTRARSASGLTLIQLMVWSAVVMVVPLVLYPLLVPPGGCREKARASSCLSNLKQLSLALTLYVQDWDDTYPADVIPSDRHRAMPRGSKDPTAGGSPIHTRWVEQLLPYLKYRKVFACPSDAKRQRSEPSVSAPGVAGPLLVSYGPNRLFMEPDAYGWKKHAISGANITRPEEKYFMAECFTREGFDLDSLAYMRYPNYDPELRQNGWTLEQYRAAGRVAWPDKIAEPITRHMLGSNVLFADGHVKWLRHDRIPDNDGRHSEQYPKLLEVMVPWQVGSRE